MDSFDILKTMFFQTPQVYAIINGSGIHGIFCAYPYLDGSVIMVEVYGLPTTANNKGIHAMHIHEGNQCSGDASDPYKNVGAHFTTNKNEHPAHTGDLAPLFSYQGYAWLSMYVGKFKPEDIIDRTIIIHEGVDDFTTQPSGNSGNKIACGVIKRMYS